MYITRTVTIANGASLSAALDVRELTRLGYSLHRVNMPAAWTAAGLSFEISLDNATFRALFDEAIEVFAAAAAANRAISLRNSFASFFSIQYLKVRSGTAAAPVPQGGDRTLELVFAPLPPRLGGGRTR